MDWTEFKYREAPKQSGIYGIKHKKQWLYVGRSKNIRARISGHTAFRMSEGLNDVTYWHILSNEIRSLEKQAIQALQPLWNGLAGYRFEYHMLPGRNIWVSTLHCEIPSTERFDKLTWD